MISGPRVSYVPLETGFVPHMLVVFILKFQDFSRETHTEHNKGSRAAPAVAPAPAAVVEVVMIIVVVVVGVAQTILKCSNTGNAAAAAAGGREVQEEDFQTPLSTMQGAHVS